MSDTSSATSQPPESSEPDGVMARAIDQLAALVDRVDPSQTASPTPCASWDVATLLDHVVADLPNFLAAAKGEEVDWSEQPPSVAPDWASAFREGGDRLLSAWQVAGSSEPGIPPDLVTAEFAVHAWDLATALGGRSGLDPGPAERGLAMMQGMLQPSMRGSEAEGKAFGTEVSPPADASTYDRLVAFAGRDPRWSPPTR
jgi:uncharacterized protein (TIGR03083 family)